MKRLFGPLTPKGGILALLILMSMALSSSGQSVVNQLENVKKPGMGKLYFSKKDSSLNVWKGKWVKILHETAGMPSVPPVVVPPVVVPPVLDEIPLGYWDAPDRLLVAKLLDGKYHLLQTNAARSYYVPRGKNLLNDSRTKVNSDVLTGDLLPSLATGNSDLGGLYPPATFKDVLMTAKGFVKNVQGEWVLRQTQGPPVVVPPVVNVPVADKIKVPVGAIFWDNWERDYWQDVNPKYDYLINHITKNRFAATEWMDKFQLVPFYGDYHAPEKVKMRYNVRWSQADGRNLYDEREVSVSVKFDKTAADTEREIKYYKDAGFDWICFNYYSDESYLSNTRRQFVNMQDKLGMKMTFMIISGRSDAEVSYIADLMTKDYWFRIGGKPVLYLNQGDWSELNRYRAALKAKGGGDIYAVYYQFGGLPMDVQDLFSKMPQAVSAYSQSCSDRTADGLIGCEVSARESFINQYGHLSFQIIPNLTLGMEELGLRTSVDPPRGPGVEAASLAQIDKKCELVSFFVRKHPDKVPAILWYAGNEILEAGETLVPKKRKDGTIDTSVLDTVARWLD